VVWKHAVLPIVPSELVAILNLVNKCLRRDGNSNAIVTSRRPCCPPIPLRGGGGNEGLRCGEKATRSYSTTFGAETRESCEILVIVEVIFVRQK
jgi:hypothetical protein